jgi:hypothetical protein
VPTAEQFDHQNESDALLPERFQGGIAGNSAGRIEFCQDGECIPNLF